MRCIPSGGVLASEPLKWGVVSVSGIVSLAVVSHATWREVWPVIFATVSGTILWGSQAGSWVLSEVFSQMASRLVLAGVKQTERWVTQEALVSVILETKWDFYYCVLIQSRGAVCIIKAHLWCFNDFRYWQVRRRECWRADDTPSGGTNRLSWLGVTSGRLPLRLELVNVAKLLSVWHHTLVRCSLALILDAAPPTTSRASL